MSVSHLFSEDVRRNPYAEYERFRREKPLWRDPGSGHWMIFDYAGVRRVLSDFETFSSKHGPADWMIFTDPPRHTWLRGLVSKAFTPKSIANLEPRIAALSSELIDQQIERGEMDLVADFSAALPLRVIGDMLGIPPADRARFGRWNDAILNMSYAIVGSPDASAVFHAFLAVTDEMREYLADLLARRQAEPQDDLLTRLASAELDGERLTSSDILGFFQLLLLAGSETTTNLINNAILCLIEHPAERRRLLENPELLPGAIEEVLRYRSPFQWMFRLAQRDVELHGQTVRTGQLVLAVMGSANHDPAQFPDPERFDISRDPNPHLAFGLGNHFCLGAPLARLEARIALGQLLNRLQNLELASTAPWEPRKGLHVHGPSKLPVRFQPAAV